MAHEVGLKIAQEIEISQYGRVEFPVKVDGKAHGRMRVARRGIEWAPRGSQVYQFALSWKELAAVMEEHGKKVPRRKTKPASR